MANVEVKIETKIALPSQYTKVEYITIDEGSPRIVLPSTTDYNTTYLYLEYMMDEPATQEYIYSIRMTGDDIGYQDNLRGIGSVYVYNYGMYDDRRVLPDGSTISYDYAPAEQKNIFERKGNSIYFNNSQPQITGDALQNYVPTGVATDDIILLGIKIDDSIRVYNHIKLYRFKLGNSERWLYDLVPCIRNSDNVAGVYDISNGVFYTDTEHGTFKAGSAIDPNNDGYPLYINKYNGLKSVESLSQSTSQPKEIFYGVVPSTGSVDIIDVDGKIADMVQNGAISNSNVPVSTYVNNKEVQNGISTDSSYNINNKQLTLQLADELEKWDAFQFDGIIAEENKSLYDVLQSVLSNLYTSSEIDAMLQSVVYTVSNTQTTVEQYLKDITIPLAYLGKGSIRSGVDKICQVAQLNVTTSTDGQITFVSARPVLPSNNAIISIPKGSQFGALNKDLIVKNKFNSVFIPTNNIEISGKKIDTKEIKNYQFNSYSDQYSNYSNVVDSGAYNPNIYVFAKHLKAENNTSSSGYFYNIIIYDIDLPDNIKKPLRFRWDTSWTSRNSGQAEISESATYSRVANIYDATNDNKTIISQWVNFDGDTPSSVKTGAPNLGISIRINADNTITVYLLLFTDQLTQNSTRVARITKQQSSTISVDTFDSKYDEKTRSYDVEFVNNELLQANTTYNGSNIIPLLQNSILSDYSNGVKVATTSVACVNYYDTNGNLVKNWEDGDIIAVGDIVNFKSDSLVYYKVTGRKFRYSGVPMLDLELQEVK